jgi:hypothetical protein
MALSVIDQTGLSQTQIASAVNMPTGSVIQVVQGQLLTSQTIASGSSTQTPQATNLTATITPQFSTSRIKVSFYIPYQYIITSVSGSPYGNMFIYRNGSNVVSGYGFVMFGENLATGNQWGTAASCYIDSPASTSSLTYTIWVAFGNSSGSFVVSATPGFTTQNYSQIILEEIR